MDKIDLEILQILVKDARMPFSKVGKMLGISIDLVKKRYQGIKDRNPNLKSTVILDTKQMGLKTVISFYIKALNEEGIPKIRSKLENYPKIVNIVDLIGDFDFFCYIYAADFKDFYEIMEYLERIKEIKVMRSAFSNNNEFLDSPVGAELLVHEVK